MYVHSYSYVHSYIKQGAFVHSQNKIMLLSVLCIATYISDSISYMYMYSYTVDNDIHISYT